MNRSVVLDTSILGMVTHPRANTEIAQWLKSLLENGTTVCVPEIVDYELRRELLRADKPESVRRLDELEKRLKYLPISTTAMLKAAEFWAKARNEGIPTADDTALDGDVILAAQAVDHQVSSAVKEIVVATSNVGHLSRFVPASRWEDIG